MSSKDFYDGSALLSQKDIRGEKPGIYLAVTNRTGGKTFFFSRYLLRDYLKTGETQGLLIRWDGDLKTRARSFAADVMTLDKQMDGHTLASEGYGKFAYNVFMDTSDSRPAVRVFALNDSEKIRENSSLMQDIKQYFFDEFQPETEAYVPQEVTKFRSIHTSIARGGGSHVRYVPVYMASNAVSKINPYFIGMGIHKKVIGSTRFTRGDGWVLEQCKIDMAAREQEKDPFNRGWTDDSYGRFASSNEYLLDDSIFIEKRPIRGRCTALLQGYSETFGLWSEPGGIYYISSKYDPSCKTKVAIDRRSQSGDNTSATSFLAQKLHKAYDLSLVRFSDPSAYAAFMGMYDMRLFM